MTQLRKRENYALTKKKGLIGHRLILTKWVIHTVASEANHEKNVKGKQRAKWLAGNKPKAIKPHVTFKPEYRFFLANNFNLGLLSLLSV